MTACFRPLTLADLDTLETIEQRCFLFPWSRGQLAESVQHHSGWGCPAPASPALMGYAFSMTVLDEMHLLNLVIDRPWQRHGWGHQLLDHVLKTARQQGILSVLLEVRASNEAARRLYQSARFEVVGLRRGYYATHQPMLREDALVMRRLLFPEPDHILR